MRDSCRILVGGDLKEIAQLKELGVNGKIIIKQIFKQWDEEAWTRKIRTGRSGGFL
jgi:hypothetical protein